MQTRDEYYEELIVDVLTFQQPSKASGDYSLWQGIVEDFIDKLSQPYHHECKLSCDMYQNYRESLRERIYGN